MSDAPVDLYIAAYMDPDAAQEDWDELKRLAKEDIIRVDSLVLVRRDADGKVHVKDNLHEVGIVTGGGVVGGALIGLIFPPSILAAAVVGGGIGAGAGGLLDHHRKSEIKHDVEDSLPPNSSGIVALFEEKWTADMEKLLARAEKITKHEVDSQSVENIKASASSSGEGPRSDAQTESSSTESASASTETAEPQSASSDTSNA
jgi:uncharacterized membrane protein